MIRQGLRYRASVCGVLYPYSVTRLKPYYSYVCQSIEDIPLIGAQSIVTMAIYDENNRFIGTDKFLNTHFVENESRKSIYEEW